jgi:post-segregation antitoxin (ccd killing protein)
MGILEPRHKEEVVARKRKHTNSPGVDNDASQREPAEANSDRRQESWRVQNAAAIAEFNHYIAQNGLPMAKWRQF